LVFDQKILGHFATSEHHLKSSIANQTAISESFLVIVPLMSTHKRAHYCQVLPSLDLAVAATSSLFRFARASKRCFFSSILWAGVEMNNIDDKYEKCGAMISV